MFCQGQEQYHQNLNDHVELLASDNLIAVELVGQNAVKPLPARMHAGTHHQHQHLAPRMVSHTMLFPGLACTRESRHARAHAHIAVYSGWATPWRVRGPGSIPVVHGPSPAACSLNVDWGGVCLVSRWLAGRGCVGPTVRSLRGRRLQSPCAHRSVTY